MKIYLYLNKRLKVGSGEYDYDDFSLVASKKKYIPPQLNICTLSEFRKKIENKFEYKKYPLKKFNKKFKEIDVVNGGPIFKFCVRTKDLKGIENLSIMKEDIIWKGYYGEYETC